MTNKEFEEFRQKYPLMAKIYANSFYTAYPSKVFYFGTNYNNVKTY